MKPGFIYAIKCVDRIKIGYSKNPEARLSKISSDAPFPCELLGYWPGTLADEAAVQERFSLQRVCGEWFLSSHGLVAFIEENAVAVRAPKSRFTVKNGDSPLAIYRKARGLTQGKVAEQLGIATSHVSYIEASERGCSLELGLKISAMTDGEVPLESLVMNAPEAAE